MVDSHPLPPGLEPHPHEHGLASGDLGELAATIGRLLPRIGHFQLAENPGRNEPGTGEINYAFLFAHLDRLGYKGWIGCEYKPLNGTVAGLGWMNKFR